MSEKGKGLIINKAFIPSGYNTKKKESLYAEFYSDGRLKHYGFYIKGSSSGTWQLNLAHGRDEGQAIKLKADGSIHEGYIYKDGAEKYAYGRGLERHAPLPMPFLKFVKQWITEIWLLDRKDETESDRKNVPTDEECRHLDLNVRLLRVGMSLDDTSKLIHRTEVATYRLNPHQTIRPRDNAPLEATYTRKPGYGLRYWVNLEASPPHIRDFELFGDGWSKETWEIVEKNRKQKPLGGQQ